VRSGGRRTGRPQTTPNAKATDPDGRGGRRRACGRTAKR
jgi:hypothetical protein